MNFIRRLQAFRCTGSMELCTDTLRTDSRAHKPCAQTAVWSCMCIFVSRLDTMQTIRREPFHHDAPGRELVEHATARTHTHTPKGRQLATFPLSL